MFSRPERICTHFSMLQVFHSSQNTSIGRYLVDILITHRVPNYLNQLLRHEGAVVLSLGSFSPSEFCTHTCISKAKLLQFIEEGKKNHWKKLLLAASIWLLPLMQPSYVSFRLWCFLRRFLCSPQYKLNKRVFPANLQSHWSRTSLGISAAADFQENHYRGCHH